MGSDATVPPVDRGQLTVYLRMLEIPLPANYGPANEESSRP